MIKLKMIGLAAAAAAALVLLPACSSDGSKSVQVTSTDLPAGKWAFTDQTATIHCYPNGTITATGDGETWYVLGDTHDPVTKDMRALIEPTDTDSVTGLIVTPFTDMAQDKCDAA